MQSVKYHQLSPSSSAIKCKLCHEEFVSMNDPRLLERCLSTKENRTGRVAYGYNRQKSRKMVA